MDSTLKLIVIGGIMALSLAMWKQVKKLWVWRVERQIYELREELEDVATEMYRIDTGELLDTNTDWQQLQARRAWLNERIHLLQDRLKG